MIKNKHHIATSFILLYLIFAASGCVSKKKYDELLIRNQELSVTVDSLSFSLSNSEKRALSLEKELREILQTSGVSTGVAITSSILSLNDLIFTTDSVCVDNQYFMTRLSDFFEQKLRSKPMNAILRVSKLINSNTKKMIFVSSGFSEILKSNPRYETVIYVVHIYFDDENKTIVSSVDLVPLVSGGINDPRQFLFKEEQVNSYISVLNNFLSIELQKFASSEPCLKKRV